MSSAIPIEARTVSFAISMARGGNAVVPVTLYGTLFSGHTRRVRRELDRDGVAYHYIDCDVRRDARKQVIEIAGEFEAPVVRIGVEWLKAPSLPELQAALTRHGLRAEP